MKAGIAETVTWAEVSDHWVETGEQCPGTTERMTVGSPPLEAAVATTMMVAPVGSALVGTLTETEASVVMGSQGTDLVGSETATAIKASTAASSAGAGLAATTGQGTETTIGIGALVVAGVSMAAATGMTGTEDLQMTGRSAAVTRRHASARSCS